MQRFFLLFIRLIFLGLSISLAQAQTPVFYPVKPNNIDLKVDIYNVFEDSRGFIWLGTNNGVYQYDGEQVTHFSKDEGILGLDIMNIFEDVNGLIWFSTYQSGLFYFDYKQNRIASPKQNAQLVKLLKKTWISELHIAQNKDIWGYNFDYRRYGSNVDNNNLKTNIYHLSEDSLVVYNLKDSLVAAQLIKQSKYPDTKNFLQFIQAAYGEQIIPRKAFMLANSTLVGHNNGYLFIKKKEDKSFQKLNFRPNRIVTILPRYPQQILVLLEQKISSETKFHLQVFDLDSLSHPIQDIELPNSFNQCYQDREGRYWFWSPSKGIKLSPNLNIYQLNTTVAQEWNGIEEYKGKLWGWNLNGVYQDIRQTPKLIGKYRYSSFSSKQLYCNQQVYFDRYNIQDDTAIVSSILCHENHIKCLHSLNDSLLMVGTSTGFLVKNTTKQHLVFSSRTQNFIHSIYSLHASPKKVWIGSNKGLYSWNKHNTIKHEVANIQVHAIEEAEKTKTLFVGTHSKGVLVKNLTDSYYINLSHGLGSNKINSLYSEQDSILWVGTSNGLQKVVFHNYKNYSIRPIIDKLKITDISTIGDTIYTIADGKILYFNKNKLISRVNNPPPFYIKVIEINNQFVSLDSIYQLQQTQNNINIHLQHLNFEKSPDHLMYRLVHNQEVSSDWQVASSKILQYRSLAAGEWTFYYTTSLQLQKEQPTIKKVVFHIAQPLSQMLWFWLLISSSSLLAIIVIAFFLYKRQQKQLSLKKRLIELELNLLRAQMNPHFIYNAMNSILGYVMRKDPLTTANYFSRFSMLMRNIMENTKHPFIQLSKEIEALEIYLELEQLRLGKKHSCRLNISNKLKYSSFKIPPMLIQPFIENAIIHGITPLKDSGTINIDLSIINEVNLQVSITDNGIGRAASKKLKMRRQPRSRKNSMGIHNSRERINIINDTYKTNIKLTIEDLETDGKPSGTQVVLFFPNLI